MTWRLLYHEWAPLHRVGPVSSQSDLNIADTKAYHRCNGHPDELQCDHGFVTAKWRRRPPECTLWSYLEVPEATACCNFPGRLRYVMLRKTTLSNTCVTTPQSSGQ